MDLIASVPEFTYLLFKLDQDIIKTKIVMKVNED